MGIRQWIGKWRKDGDGDEGGADDAPRGSVLHALFGKEEPTPHALGEYDATTYPDALAELLRRRQEVMDELMELDLTSAGGRQAAIPRLHELLRRYPHPLAYEALINAYVDGGRWDEARGVAYAARERRHEVTHSPFPEIRMEVDRLNEWTPEEIDVLRAEREGRPLPP
ncbi:MAG TPA: hypothetical protein VFX98_17815 [Longimicrobiaceae bacterium]|nr:hypothetical protein [Longimicrobiaceae bacterium]